MSRSSQLDARLASRPRRDPVAQGEPPARPGRAVMRPVDQRAAGDRLTSQDLSSGVYVPWLVVGHEARTSNAASTLSPVMVGRDGEFAQLQGAWRTGGQMLVVRGRAGIGKSRLVRQFASWGRDAAGTVLAGRCGPTAGVVPFRPLREALLAAARVGLGPSARLTAFRPVLGSLFPDRPPQHTRAFDACLMSPASALLHP